MAKAYTEALDGLLPAEPALVVGQPTAITLSRAGGQACAVGAGARLAVADPWRCGGQNRGTDWDAVKDAYADRVIGIIERYAPGFRAIILDRAVLSPADLERDNPNLVGATASAAAITSTRISCSARRSAGRVTARRSSACIWLALRPGRGLAPAPRPASCWRRCWPAREKQHARPRGDASAPAC